MSDMERDHLSEISFWENELTQSISRDSIVAQDFVEMNQNLMSEKKAREILQEEFDRFKKISAHVRFESQTRIDTLRIRYDHYDTIILNDYTDYVPIDTVKKYFIQIPKKVSFKDQWMSLNATVDTVFQMDSMKFMNKFDVTIGYKKPDKPFKFLRKKEPVVELISYSPYTSVNYVNNITVEDKKSSIFLSPVATAIYGIGIGFGIGKLK